MALLAPAYGFLHTQPCGTKHGRSQQFGCGDKTFLVVKAALFFVLGFTIVSTLAGGLIGFAAQELGESANFESIQRVIGIIGVAS